MAQDFEGLAGYVDGQIGMYNRDLARRLDRLRAQLPEGDSQKSIEPFSLSASTLDRLTEKTADPQAAYLLDIAKAEALIRRGISRIGSNYCRGMSHRSKLGANCKTPE